MNITLTADENLVKRAREFARSHGTSLNNLIREQLQRMTTGGSAEAAAAEFLQLVCTRAGKSGKGYRFDRSEAHDR